MAETQIPSSPRAVAAWSEGGRAAVSPRERARRHAVKLLFIVYVIIMLDGVLRKYILPQAQRPLIFLQDPFVLYLYYHALRHNFVRKSGLLAMGAGLLILGLFIGVAHAFDEENSFLLALFGLRQYFFFIPLPFVMAVVIGRDDLDRFFRLNLILLILMAPLMVAQVLSPLDSWVNAGVLVDGAQSLGNGTFGGGDSTFVRAPGFFTSAGGINIILPLDAAILLLVWMMPRRERPCSRLLLGVSAAAMFLAIAASGNRGAIMGLLLVGIAGGMLPLFMPGTRSAVGAIGVSAILAIAAVGSFILFFPEQYSALYDRWIGANAGEGDFAILYRAFDNFTYFFSVIPYTPILGFGLGTGTNGADILGVNPVDSTLGFLVVQLHSDWARHIIDLGPAVGIVYIIFRVFFTLRIAVVGVGTATRRRDPTAWLIFSAVGYTFLNGLLTAQSTNTALCWFLVGLILAAPNHVRPLR